jgi:hypothetical protein
VLASVDAVISTPSTAMLEGMLQGLPVAVLDFHNRPHYVPAANSVGVPHKEKKHGSKKTKKKFCRGPTPDPRQREELPRAGWPALGKEYGRSAKMGLDRGLLYAEGPALSEEAFAEGRSLPRAGPRQKYPLPSARNPALGKINDPR